MLEDEECESSWKIVLEFVLVHQGEFILLEFGLAVARRNENYGKGKVQQPARERCTTV